MPRTTPQKRVPNQDWLRRQLLESFARADAVSDELRVMIARDFPDLLATLPPRKPPAPSTARRRDNLE
jgi:hypothetical protein